MSTAKGIMVVVEQHQNFPLQLSIFHSMVLSGLVTTAYALF